MLRTVPAPLRSLVSLERNVSTSGWSIDPETCYEDVAGDSTESFVDLRELLFEDLDHEYLFDPRFDGIDDPETREGAQMRVQPLHPSFWFAPFYEGGSVHPMTLS